MIRLLYVSAMAEKDDPRRYGDPSRGVPALPDERVWAAPMLRRLGADWDYVDATSDPLPDPAAYEAVVVGGSLGSANDREPWRVALELWLAALGDQPFMGMCGGHQLYARARGGVVERMPERQVGIFPLEWADGHLPAGLVAQIHDEVVVIPPPGAEVVASDVFGVQALRYGPGRMTVQFHPEVCPDGVRVLEGRSGAGALAWPPEQVPAVLEAGEALFRRWAEEVVGLREARAGRRAQGGRRGA